MKGGRKEQAGQTNGRKKDLQDTERWKNTKSTIMTLVSALPGCLSYHANFPSSHEWVNG